MFPNFIRKSNPYNIMSQLIYSIILFRLDSDHETFKNSAVKHSYEQKLRYLSAGRKKLNMCLYV